MKRTNLILLSAILSGTMMLTSCKKEAAAEPEAATVSIADETKTINTLLDEWHTAAAKGDHDGYFGRIAEDGRYIGTDATENWDKKAFDAFAKPYFDKGQAWDFKALERNIYFSKDGKTAWFDELLDTWMKACRGSGVLEKEGNEWKIKHYVLSMTVPNDAIDAVIPAKTKYEDSLIEKMKSSQISKGEK